MLKPFNVLLKKNYNQKIRAKSFVIMTAIYLLAIIVVAFWSDIKGVFTGDNEEAKIVAVVNETGKNLDPYFEESEAMSFTFENSSEAATKLVEDGDSSYAIILKDDAGSLVSSIVTNDPLSLNEQENISTLLELMTQYYAFESMNLTPEQQQLLLTIQPSIETIVLSEQESKTADEKYAGIIGSYALGILIYFFVITYLSIITTDVASEKGSRALEMLLVSVKPEVHFRAKVLSVFLVALTQFALMAIVGLAVLQLKDDGKYWNVAMDFMNNLSPLFIVFVCGFLLFTVLMYLIIGALFGSLVSKVEESSQVMMPAMIVIIIGFYVMISAMSNPDTLLIKIFSYIPFTSGMVMPMRIGGTDMSIVEPILSLVLLIVTVVGLYLMSTNFYKRSVLTYSSGGILQKIKTVLKVTT